MDERKVERVEPDEPAPRVERETTIIHSGGDRGGGGGGTIVAIVVLLAIVVLGFLWFNGNLGGAADEIDVNVNVDTPDIDIPEIDVPELAPPANSS